MTSIMASRRWSRAWIQTWAAIACGVGLVAPLLGQPTELLNSQRIEQAFGSYGISVLESGGTLRVSNLYSRETHAPVCRTFAVVRYPQHVDSAFVAEHAAILDGGSIGAVFSAAGWRVEKTHRHYAEIPAGAKAAELMGVAPLAPLAAHVYALDVVKADARHRYATIVEIHHPDYLTAADVRSIYGPLAQAEPDTDALEMLAIAAAKAAQ